jgi:hypothetical protein
MAPTAARDIVFAGPPELHHALAAPDRSLRLLRHRQDPQGRRRSLAGLCARQQRRRDKSEQQWRAHGYVWRTGRRRATQQREDFQDPAESCAIARGGFQAGRGRRERGYDAGDEHSRGCGRACLPQRTE